MKQLTKFATEEQYNASTYPTEYPNVSLIDEEDIRYQNIWRYEYLTLHALEAGTITITIPAAITTTYAAYIEYSKDRINWTRTDVISSDQTITINVIADDRVNLRGEAKAWGVLSTTTYGTNINSTCNINIYGNIASLLDPTSFSILSTSKTISDFTFYSLFKNNTHIISAKKLLLGVTNSTKLYNSIQYPIIRRGMYDSLFAGCSSLIEGPMFIPAFLANFGYRNMFKGCSSLKKSPKINMLGCSSSAVSQSCLGMFQNCTSLVNAPDLLSTELGQSCYQEMFSGCTSLEIAPELPATTLTDYCYWKMFTGCTSLTRIPELPATTLTNYCYKEMFSGCTSLTSIPDDLLPATTLTNYCYQYMFNGCTALTTAPELPATTLANYCYQYMFNGCTALTTAPELPATTLVSSCYSNMFVNCDSLEIAPELPATTLVQNCYYNMFYGCSSLRYIKMLATDISASGCLSNWTYNTKNNLSCVFIKSTSLTIGTGTGQIPRSASGIPTNWTVYDDAGFLESTGTQHISLPFTAGVGDTLRLDIELKVTSSSTGNPLFGHDPQFRAARYSSTTLSSCVGNISSNGGFGFTENERCKVMLSTEGMIYANGTYKALSRPLTGTISSVELFKAAGNNNKSKLTIYNCKWTRNDEVVYDLVPVKSNNVAYYYDKIGNQLWGNAGTGTFTTAS